MEPLFRTAEEYYRDTVLSQFEISEFEFKFLSDLDNIDTLDIEEVETKIIKLRIAISIKKVPLTVSPIRLV